MGKYDDLFDAAPSPTPAAVGKYADLFDEPGVVATQQRDFGSEIPSGAELTQIGRENTPAWTEAPAQAVSELVKGMIPHDLKSYAAGIFPPLAAFEQGKQLAQGDVSSIPFVGRVPELVAAEDTPAGSKERYLAAMKTLMDVGLLAGAGGERAPSPLRTEPLVPDPPPLRNLGPGTIAGDVSRAVQRPAFEDRFAVSPDITQSLAQQIQAQQVLTPDVVRSFAERAQQPIPREVPPEPTGPVSETAVEKAMRTTSPSPLRTVADITATGPVIPPPIGTPLQPVPFLDGQGGTPAAAAAAAAQMQQPGPTGFTATMREPWETPPEAPGGVPVADMPQTPVIPPEDVKYAGGGPQTEVPGTVGISQARTEAELGPGSVVPGAGAEMGSGLAYGRDYVNKGGDPRLPIRRANTSGMVGKNDVGIVHAELDRLRVERNKAAAALETNPADPVLQQNFAVADNAQRAWRKELQPVLTKASDALREAHAASMPDADVSTYQGLADLMDEHFKGERVVTPEMRTALTKAAKGVRESRNIANGEMAKVEGTLEKQVRARGKKMMSPEELEASIKNRLETEFTDCVLGA